MKVVFVVAVLGLVGCSPSAVTTGQKIFITPSDSAHLGNCELLGQVQIEENLGVLLDRNDASIETKNRLRDATADKYPDADTVSYSDINLTGAWTTTAHVMGTVFRCFNK